MSAWSREVVGFIIISLFFKMTLHFNSTTDNSVHMRGVTWSRDSHGLFDYESKNVTRKSWVCQDPARILRHQNDISITPLSQELTEEQKMAEQMEVMHL